MSLKRKRQRLKTGEPVLSAGQKSAEGIVGAARTEGLNLEGEGTGVKRDGSASDKRDGDGPSTPPPLPSAATPVDEPVAGEHQITASPEISTLMTQVLDIENLKRALAQVRRNKGAPGIDGMTVDELRAHLKANWLAHHPRITGRWQLLPDAGTACRNPKARRKKETPGHPHCGGPVHPASHRTSGAAMLGTALPSQQLRLSVRAQRSPSDASRAGHDPTRIRLGGGHRPGGVL